MAERSSPESLHKPVRLLPKLSQRAEKQLLYPLLKRLCAENGHFALKNTESLARRLLDATLSKLNLEIDDLDPKSQRPQQNSIYLRGGSNSDAHTTSIVTGFENLLESCFMCLLQEEGMALLRNTHESLSDSISRLPAKGPKRNNSVGPWSYGAPTPGEGFLASLVIILHKYQLLDPPPFVGDLFILLFTRYIQPHQPKNPPPRPSGWSHKPRFCSRHDPSRGKIHGTCHECGLMQDFIRASDQKQGRFTYAKKIRSHLEMVLPREHYRCATDTTRGQGGCQTLVVTKIGKDTEFNEDMRTFIAEVRQYEQRLLPFRQPVVRRILGNLVYGELMLEGPDPSAMPPGPVSTKRAADESPDQPASTRQRTDDVIDLTED